METIEVEIHHVILVVQGKHTRLTKSIAKQFPIQKDSKRVDAAMTGQQWPKPICKVQGRVLEEGRVGWFLLIPDDEAGLAWFPAICPGPHFAEGILARGGWVDDLATIPTAIL